MDQMEDKLTAYEPVVKNKNYTDLVKNLFWLICSLVAVVLSYRAGYYRVAIVSAVGLGHFIDEVFREVYWLFRED